MFSAPVKKIGKMPSGLFLGMAAGMAFVLLLAALVHVVNGQVEQGRVRQAQFVAVQTAISDCSANFSGATRRQCIEQINAGDTPYSTYTPKTELQASIGSPAHAGSAKAGAPSLVQAQGFVQATFATR